MTRRVGIGLFGLALLLLVLELRSGRTVDVPTADAPAAAVGSVVRLEPFSAQARLATRQKPAAPSKEPKRAYLAVRMLPRGSEADQIKALQTLAAVVEPSREEFVPGASVGELLRSECGLLPTTLLGELKKTFVALNPNLGARGEGQLVSIPPCPRWETGLTLSVRPGATVWQHVNAAMGTAGDATMRQVAELSGLDLASLYHVKPGQAITVPMVTGYRQWRLKEGVAQNALMASLEVSSKAGILDFQLEDFATRLDIVRPVTASDLGTSKKACLEATNRADWPLDSPRLLEVLRENARLNRRRKEDVRRAVLLVADTGLGETRAFAGFLKLNAAESRTESRQNFDDDGNGYRDDAFGVKVSSRRGPPSPWPLDQRRDHGVEVAGALLGGLRDAALIGALRERISIKVVNLVDTDEAPTGRISGSSIHGALMFATADNVNADVVNLSVAGTIASPTQVAEKLSSSTLPLIVVAAGNDGRDVDLDEDMFPAAYRVHYPDRMLVVAAHDPQGKLAPFSNRGRGTVDIAAPGCAVPTLDATGSQRLDQGTSMAAPLVSLVAGLLSYEGLAARDVRNRIIASTLFDPALAKDVATGGRLSATRALSLFRDIVETSSGVFLGQIVDPYGLDFAGIHVPRSKFLRVTAIGGGQYKALVKHETGLAVKEGAFSADAKLILKASGNKKDISIPLSDVRDIVFRQYDPPTP